MRYLVFLISFALVLGGCAGQPLPESSPSPTEIAQAPSPTPTEVIPTPTATEKPTATATPEATFTPSPTSTRELTPTPKPTATPTLEQPTATPPPEVVPSNEICAVGELEGRCYQRTPQGGYRSGVWEGHAYPDGSVAHYTMDPDRMFNGRWVVGGRIERIDFSQNLIYLKGRGENVIKVKMEYGSPYFYTRMQRTPDSLPLPWREAAPEVRPILDKDIIPGDYLYIALSDAWIDFSNSKTSDQNYQAIIEAQARYNLPLTGIIIEMYQ